MLESLQDTFRHLLIDGPDAMGTAPCAAPVAAARAEIAAFLHAAGGPACGSRSEREASARNALVRHRGRRDLRNAGRPTGASLPTSTRSWRGAPSGGTVVAAMLGQLFAGEPTLGRSAIPLMPPARPRRVAAASSCRRCAPTRRSPRTPTWAGSPVETGALARMRSDPLVAAVARKIRQRRRHADRRAPRGARGADRRSSPDRRRGPKRRRGSRASRSATAKGSRRSRPRADCCCTARGCATNASSITRSWRRPNGTFTPTARSRAGSKASSVDDERHLLRAARLAVHALDPCVGSRIEVGHA